MQLIVRTVKITDLTQPVPYRLIERLTACEQERLAAYALRADQWRFVIGRALMRTVLRLDFGLTDWSLKITDHGRPEVRPADPAIKIDINLAHADDLVVCAGLQNGRVGIDVERPAAFTTYSEIAPMYLHPAELSFLHNQHDRRLSAALFWVLKEALLKCRGTGLSTDPRGICIDLPPKPGHWTDRGTIAEPIAYLVEDEALIGLAISHREFTSGTVNCTIARYRLDDLAEGD
jgi:4'-phosphopantetheinyl transferase